MIVTIDLTEAELGWLLMAVRGQRTRDDKSVRGLTRKFGDTLDHSSGGVIRHRLGLEVALKLTRAAKK